jgi:hypothetical protein
MIEHLLKMSALFILMIAFSANTQFGEIQPLEITAFANWFLKNEIENPNKVKLFPISMNLTEGEFRHEYNRPKMPGTVSLICTVPIRYESSPLLVLKELDPQLDTAFIFDQIRQQDPSSRWWKNYHLENVAIAKITKLSGFGLSKKIYIGKPIFTKNRDFVMLPVFTKPAMKRYENGKILIYQKDQSAWKLVKEIGREKINPER